MKWKSQKSGTRVFSTKISFGLLFMMTSTMWNSWTQLVLALIHRLTMPQCYLNLWQDCLLLRRSKIDFDCKQCKWVPSQINTQDTERQNDSQPCNECNLLYNARGCMYRQNQLLAVSLSKSIPRLNVHRQTSAKMVRFVWIPTRIWVLLRPKGSAFSYFPSAAYYFQTSLLLS